MNLINELPDDLLLKILSLVPLKTVFDAQLVSKRWRNLWKRLSSFHYDQAFHNSDKQFSLFVKRTMESIESPVIESLLLRVTPTDTPYSVMLGNDLSVNRRLRKLELVSTNRDRSTLTKDIYQYQNLVILTLESFILEDYNGIPILLPSLKVLHLSRVMYSSDESVSNLLSSLLSLQDLILDRCLSYNPTTTLAIAVPCLKRLTFVRCPDYCRNHLMTLNVNAPSLNYLSIEEYWRNVSFADRKMEKLIEADVSVTFSNAEKLLKALVSVQRLSLCLVTSKIPQANVIFDQLVRLELCTCQKEWWNLLERVLLDSPKLRFLKLHQKHCFGIVDPEAIWKEPSFVPECVASRLETFEWRGYEGTQEEKKIASYILKSAWRLKTATIYPLISHQNKTICRILKNSMHRELENLYPWFTCKLVFK